MTTIAQWKAILDKGDLGLNYEIKTARAEIEVGKEFNLHYWCSVFQDVARAHLVGLGADERTRELATLVLDQLTADRIGGHQFFIDGKPAPRDTAHDRARAYTTRGLAHWLLTLGSPAEDLGAAASAFGEYFDLQYGSKKSWRVEAVDELVLLQCAAERPADTRALFERPQLAGRSAKPGDARTAMDIGHAWAKQQMEGLMAAAQRVHRTMARRLYKASDWDGIALSTYVTASLRRERPKDAAGAARLFAATASEITGAN